MLARHILDVGASHPGGIATEPHPASGSTRFGFEETSIGPDVPTIGVQGRLDRRPRRTGAVPARRKSKKGTLNRACASANSTCGT
eukprot:8033544-Pyramimonas_sp.AAC.1